jgi:hypothetical protein
MNINAGVLRRLAWLASNRTDGSLDEAQQIDMDAIVAVVFSPVALEAFLNELAALAGKCLANDSHCVKTFASLLSDAEQAKATIRFKHESVRTLFKSYDKGPRLQLYLAGASVTGHALWGQSHRQYTSQELQRRLCLAAERCSLPVSVDSTVADLADRCGVSP